MASTSPEPQRRRGERLVGALLDAAWAEVSEHGWADFSMARTAERAGASKKSLYARWPDKGAMLAAALHRASTSRDLPMPPSGDLREDLYAALLTQAEFLSGPFGDAIRGLYASLPSLPPELRALGDRSRAAHAYVEILAAAQERGQLGSSPIPPPVAGVGTQLVIQHYLGHGTPPTHTEVAEIVDAIWLPALHAAAGGADS